jgi:NAD(P)-dependent dehydrogenase (short-subunit alcohol dehydrogenase family)
MLSNRLLSQSNAARSELDGVLEGDDMLDFGDRVAAVTGGSQGIGFAAARIMAAGGARIVILDIDEEMSQKAVAHLAEVSDVPATAIHTDVSDQAAVKAAFAQIADDCGRLDVLVNNAGITGPASPVWEIETAYFQRLLAVHLLGAFYCITEAVPMMLANDYGRVVNVASVAGKEGNSGSGGYSAAKAGLIGLTKSLGKELALTGIRANAVTPGVIETNLGKRDGSTPEHIARLIAKIPMGRKGQPDEVGELIAWVASDRCTFTTASVFDVSGGRTTY